MKKWLQLFYIVGISSGLSVSLPAYAGKSKVVFVRSEGEKFEEVAKSMAREMEKSYETSEIILKKDSDFEGFKSALQKQGPALLVLLENKSVDFALKYNASSSSGATKLKAVALLSLNLRHILKGVPEISGIAYEPSPFLLVTQFRYLTENPIKKVIVFFRKSLFQSNIDETAKQLKGEGIALKAIDVEQKGSSKAEILSFLEENVPKALKEAGRDEVLWVQLDSAIINQATFNKVWSPVVGQSKVPFISSVENLVDTSMHFCTFAVTPNFPDLVNQAMQQVDGILKDHQAPSTFGVEEAVSVNKIFNKTRAKEIQLKFQENRLSDVKVIE